MTTTCKAAQFIVLVVGLTLLAIIGTSVGDDSGWEQFDDGSLGRTAEFRGVHDTPIAAKVREAGYALSPNLLRVLDRKEQEYGVSMAQVMKDPASYEYESVLTEAEKVRCTKKPPGWRWKWKERRWRKCVTNLRRHYWLSAALAMTTWILS